ncbi:MAG: hypothetical protein WC630_04695 [Candidatus Babeliales bacterium]
MLKDQDTRNNLLKKNVALLLKYFVSELRAKRTDVNFFEFLILKMIPLIRLLRPDVVEQWEADKANYNRQYHQLQDAINRQILIREGVLKNVPYEDMSREEAELMQLYHAYNLDNVAKPWVAWDYLSIAASSWESHYDSLKRKETFQAKVENEYKAVQEQPEDTRKKDDSWLPSPTTILKAWRRDGQLWEEQTFSTEMKAIQNKRQGTDLVSVAKDGTILVKTVKKVSLFERYRFDRYLDLILNEVCGENQALLYDRNNSFLPYALEIILANQRDLLLEVEWVPRCVEVLVLHLFHEEVGDQITPMKCFHKVTIDGEVGKIFSGATTSRVISADILAAHVNPKKLLAQLQTTQIASNRNYLKLQNGNGWYLKD